jgi:hypothetical protein
MKPTTCYLCGDNAEYKDVTGGIAIRCPNCLYYWLSSMVLHLYFEKHNGSELLDQANKDRLKNYIRENYDREKFTGVPINIKTFLKVTGIKSEGY